MLFVGDGGEHGQTPVRAAAHVSFRHAGTFTLLGWW